MLNDDVWKIIKSYLLDQKQMQRRQFIKQMGEERKKEELKWRRILFLERIHEKYSIESVYSNSLFCEYCSLFFCLSVYTGHPCPAY
jgi:hypothetical protein